jgi:uncharacterized protein YndB with AHSA1/START domain
MKKITVNASIAATQQKVWDYYTLPEHITKWNFAHPSWHCPSASNDLKIGGLYHARMEAVDGSFGFDFDAIYTEINIGSNFTYGFAGRVVSVELRESNSHTAISVSFDPESENPIELQRDGWQAILNNFKRYVEAN